jgi:hypothetical protein
MVAQPDGICPRWNVKCNTAKCNAMEMLNALYQTAILLLYPLAICFGLALIVGFGELLTVEKSSLVWTTWNLFLIGLPVAFVGYLIGFMVGDSRTGEIGSLVTAVLGVIAGLNIFAVSSDRANRTLMGFSVCLLAVALFVGTLHGAIKRENGREERLNNLAEQEFRIRIQRKNLDLPEDIPDWMTTGEPTSK